MATSNQPAARFRSATEFPKTVEHLPPPEAAQLYTEMRECLVHTNRSRAQLIRRNDEHKQKAVILKEDIGRLQTAIQQLNLEKIAVSAEKQQAMAALEQELTTMTSHLDQLSSAFDGVAELEDMSQSPMGLFAAPNRFIRFLQAVKAIVLWWRSEQAEPPLPPAPEAKLPADAAATDAEHRRNNPHEYSDQASIGRSLLDK